MSKKKFANIGGGSNRLEAKFQGAISNFVEKNTENKDKPRYNPLVDDKPKRVKEKAIEEQQDKIVKEVAPQQELKEKEVIEIVEPKKVEVNKKVPVQAKAENKVEKIIERPKTVRAKTIALPNDFKTHSALFSGDQLNKLREVVYFKKWKINPKYSIKQAIYEALQMYLVKRKSVSQFPDDFVPYSPGISLGQWEELEAVVAEIKYRENKSFALKYAIYEAIEKYLKSNPITDN